MGCSASAPRSGMEQSAGKQGSEPEGEAAVCPAMQSLYDKLGGPAAVEAAVDIFYKKIMADAELEPFFEGIDMNKQMRKQVAFMTFAFGGAPHYGGRGLYAVHKRLITEKGLREEHFDMVAGHLVATLQELGVAQNLVDEVVGVVGPTKAVIFGDGTQ
ncbi:Group 1 truncated hemoglobin glbN [Tetrabaena socialis]|uniref:Group 1 truncated hemoglobin glbN n=1 Tax=Tetrabaena socialis TaxID=47790 RepID=A0A2J8AJW7_9CHLO|nr:Group 1 truncated hemoglobin glbN [Tetrabaena socialis]|eukprot:PNH12814.1 Group 1 truncated hemoglobin glbN [Tetrabaena socialis]